MADPNNLQVIFKLSKNELTKEIYLKPEIWRVLAQINGERSVAEIAHTIRMDEGIASRIVDTLYQAGVLEIAAGNAPAVPASVDGNFFEQISRELTWSMGPLAEIILSEEIGALGETRERFPRNRISELVERVTEAISDESERIRFQQIMLEVIRKL